MTRILFPDIPPSALPAAQALVKIALPEPPPDSGEPPQAEDNQLPGGVPAQPRKPLLHALGAVAGPALAFGVGSAAGYGGQLAAEKLLRMGPGAVRPLRAAAPLLGGAFGLALQQYKSREQQELRRALEAYKSQSAGVSPGE